MWEVLGYILLGVVVGPIARFLVPGKDPMSVLQTVLVGAAGSLIGGYVFQEWITPDNNGIPWVAAILGAVLLVVIFRFVRRSSAAT